MSDSSTMQGSERFHDYDLTQMRAVTSRKDPKPHQVVALKKLDDWYQSKSDHPRGAILVLPTGGGKTFTAVRFLCKPVLSDNFKVLWLAHTHHLLEQAQESFKDSAGEITEPKPSLRVRVVSGATGHFKLSHIKTSDDVVIGSLQQLSKGLQDQHAALTAFIDDACGKLLVVFDEAHHAPAPSYRRLLNQIRERCPNVMFLGLTATPTYSDETRRGWLAKLFPQLIVHQATAQDLMAAGILAKPILEHPPTDFTPPELTEQEYARWVAGNQDVPEALITILAKDRGRNEKIANHYVNNRAKYGKTIIFADRWMQCEAICAALRKRGVNADAVYSQVVYDGGTPEDRNKRTASHNARILEQFKKRDGGLDVLVNVRMLTEGTDVPDVNTVFLTRQTTSQSLLTQMIGRALRGPAVGGTAEAYIVAFFDQWKQQIQWAEYAQPATDGTDVGVSPPSHRVPVQMISIELIRRLAEQMDSGDQGETANFLSFLPCGWFNVIYDAAVAGTDDIENVNRMILVYEHDKDDFFQFVSTIPLENLKDFEGVNVQQDDIAPRLRTWEKTFFKNQEHRVGVGLTNQLLALVRHIAQNDHQPPAFFPFDDRNKHDLDKLAAKLIDDKVDFLSLDSLLATEFARPGLYWKTLFSRFEQFREQVTQCMHRAVDKRKGQIRIVGPITPDPLPDPEPSDEVKKRIRERDNNRCVCCGSTVALQIDHIKSRYNGGSHDLENLQLLCRLCNGLKGIREIKFSQSRTPLKSPPAARPVLEIGDLLQADDLAVGREQALRRWINFFYECGAVKAIDAVHKEGRLGTTKIRLHEGNDRSWLNPYIGPAIRVINGAGSTPNVEPVDTTAATTDSEVSDDSDLNPTAAPDTRDESETDTPGATTLGALLASIFDVEGFKVEIIRRDGGGDGRKLRGDHTRGTTPYPYRNRLSDKRTVENWKRERFLKNYEWFDTSAFSVRVLDAAGNVCAGQTKLRTVRDTFG